MSHQRNADLVWTALVALTLIGAWLGEQGGGGSGVMLFVVAVIAIKGRLVIDHFMELRQANVRLRRLMRGYFYVMPALVLAVHFLGGRIAGWTAW